MLRGGLGWWKSDGLNYRAFRYTDVLVFPEDVVSVSMYLLVYIYIYIFMYLRMDMCVCMHACIYLYKKGM